MAANLRSLSFLAAIHLVFWPPSAESLRFLFVDGGENVAERRGRNAIGSFMLRVACFILIFIVAPPVYL